MARDPMTLAPSEPSYFKSRLPDQHASFASSSHHVSGSAVPHERHDEIRPVRVEHRLIADRTSGAAMCGPVGEKQAAGDGAGLRPFGGKCVGAGGSAGNSRMAGDDQQVLRRGAMCR